MPRALHLGLVLTLVGVAGFLVSGYAMARRVRAYYDAAPPPQHLLVPVAGRDFTAFGHPVRLTDATTDTGHPALRIEYAGHTDLIPVHPPAAPLPTLDGYSEWLALLAFAPMADGRVRLDEAALARGEPGARLVLVKRNAAPGFEDDPGGLVARTRWTFDFVEFLPDGTLSAKRMQFRNRRGVLPAQQDDPATKVQPIEERSWEWQAALYAIPKLHISNYRYKTDAVSGVGWTLPAAGFSVLILTAGAALLASTRVRPR